jgi:hypothetical protein
MFCLRLIWSWQAVQKGEVSKIRPSSVFKNDTRCRLSSLSVLVKGEDNDDLA